MDPLLINGEKPLQHVSTLVRQLVFDVVFVVENIVLITIALNSDIKELKENQVTYKCILHSDIKTLSWLARVSHHISHYLTNDFYVNILRLVLVCSCWASPLLG